MIKGKPIHINKIKLGLLNYGENKIHSIEITSIKYDPFNTDKPMKVEGVIQIENPAKERDVKFTYYNGQLSVNLNEFVYKKAEKELINKHLRDVCESSTINVGYKYIHLTLWEWITRLIVFFIVGVGLGIGVSGK